MSSLSATVTVCDTGFQLTEILRTAVMVCDSGFLHTEVSVQIVPENSRS
jgi:hypothetical protein